MEAGVDSLGATELSSRLRTVAGVGLSPTLVFEQPTPRGVAALILEDDVALADNISAVISSALEEVPADFDLLYAGYRLPNKGGNNSRC